MANTQKGPRSASIGSNSAPLEVREGEYQREVGTNKAYVLNTGDGKMPTITLETKQSGAIASTNPVSQRPGSADKVLRPDFDEKYGGEENLHDQWIKPNAIEPDERLR